MRLGSRLPNIITMARILIAPLIFYLILVPQATARLAAFMLFLAAALSDLWDGWLARKHGWISDFGKLWDPIADKLLMVVTLIPLYMITHPVEPLARWPVVGALPLWVVIVIFAREILITALRAWAARRGLIIPAGRAGKHKAFLQNIFVGTAILWHTLHTAAREAGWTSPGWELWQAFHGLVLVVTLSVAVFLTLWSLGVYLWNWRALLTETA
ncbi:MAG TPA: CDP-diacylglycerol--glycerol-3-phosphate 3-phosphatidyltransferase [Longimicrobiales bacterium]|nr:CDP-diacylglycerol--glycerol-3-phosphate 3-phosphatidyltransferase [Longimicrobiales bacterium]